MARRWKVETAKTGLTANDRRVLVEVAAPTAEPTLSSDGYATQGVDLIHLLFEVAGTSPVFLVQLHWYCSTSAKWHKGEALTVNTNDIVTVEVQGLERIALEVVSVSGTATPTINTWAALAVQVT